MELVRHVLVLANCFIMLTGTDTNSSRYLQDNPVPYLERYFSRSLYQKLALEGDGGNLLVSPLGVDVLLATLLEGAQGVDREHLTRLLGLDQVDGFPYSDVKIGYLQSLKNISRILQVSTRLYISKEFVVNNDFLSVANDYYQAGVEMLNLTNKEETVSAINNYAKESSSHTIREVVTEGDISENSTMICISTVHFSEQWALLFPNQITTKQQFRSSSRTRLLVQMMHVKNQLHFVWNKTLKAKMLALDFVSKNVSMMFMLPDKEYELYDLEARLATIDYVTLLRLVRSTPPVNVDLRMPRFTLREDLDLGKTLKQLGLTSLFTPEADLTGISTGVGLHVSKVKQKTHLVIGEYGVEASSTEVIEAETGTEDDNYWHKFHADHPFLFFLVMEELVVFQGRVVNP